MGREATVSNDIVQVRLLIRFLGGVGDTGAPCVLRVSAPSYACVLEYTVHCHPSGLHLISSMCMAIGDVAAAAAYVQDLELEAT